MTYTVVGGNGDGSGSYGVREEWTYDDLGETTVTPPDWYRERFGSNA